MLRAAVAVHNIDLSFTAAGGSKSNKAAVGGPSGVLIIAAIGGLLFLFSDFVLSWNKFTEHIPHASLYIMSTYYAALLCLFIGTLRAAQK